MCCDTMWQGPCARCAPAKIDFLLDVTTNINISAPVTLSRCADTTLLISSQHYLVGKYKYQDCSLWSFYLQRILFEREWMLSRLVKWTLYGWKTVQKTFVLNINNGAFCCGKSRIKVKSLGWGREWLGFDINRLDHFIKAWKYFSGSVPPTQSIIQSCQVGPIQGLSLNKQSVTSQEHRDVRIRESETWIVKTEQ